MAGGRQRKPSRLAKEIAGIEPEPGVEGPKRPTKAKGKKKAVAPAPAVAGVEQASPVQTANVKAGGKRGRAVLNEHGEVDIQETATLDGDETPDDQADADQLYCICLGHDDSRPMIQCEGCEDWFHFDCIQLDPAEAQFLEAYYCDVCEESGSGSTRRIAVQTVTAQTAKPKTAPKAKSKVEYKTDSEEETEDVAEDAGEDDDGDDSAADPDASGQDSDSGSSSSGSSDASSAGLARNRARRTTTASGAAVYRRANNEGSKAKGASAPSRKKKRKAEGLSSDDGESDEDYTGEGRKKRKASASIEKPTVQRKVSSSIAPSAPSRTSATPSSSSASVEKTRKACVDQFTKLFSSGGFASPDVAATFAADVEKELFKALGEPDANGIKTPKTKYLGKFRSLLFNIKNNPDFLSGLAQSGIAPAALALMSNEDLQTPEQRAEADRVRQQSLKDSVKVVVEAPRAKRTHKGEEAIDFDAIDVEAATRQEAARRKKDAEEQQAKADEALAKAREAGSPTASARDRSSSITVPIGAAGEGSPLMGGHRRPSLAPHRSISGSNALNGQTADGATAMDLDERELADRELMPPPSARLSVNFDLESVWGAMKPSESPVTPSAPTFGKLAADKAEDDMDLENSSDDSRKPTPEYEPELTPEEEVPAVAEPAAEEAQSDLPEGYDPFAGIDGGGAGEDDFDKLIHGDEFAAQKEAAAATVPPTESLPTVWNGNIMTSEDGGFAARAVQVGGRPIGTHANVWQQLFQGDTLTVVGRIPTTKSVEYLVQSHFAPTRELIVVELLPDVSEVPPLPPADRVKQHRQRLIDLFAGKDRHAAIGLKDASKRLVKDVYLVPLRKDASLPEFVELLDDQSLPEKGHRPSDTMLAVFVIQKGILPTVAPPPQPSGVPTSSSAMAPMPGMPTPSSLAALSMSLGAQMPPVAAPTVAAPRPPPGFIPYVPSAAASNPGSAPSALPPPGNIQVDYASLDIMSIKTLMANPQAFRSLLDMNPAAAPALARNPNLMAALQSDPSLMQQLATYPALLNALLGAGSAPAPGPGPGPRSGQSPGGYGGSPSLGYGGQPPSPTRGGPGGWGQGHPPVNDRYGGGPPRRDSMDRDGSAWDRGRGGGYGGGGGGRGSGFGGGGGGGGPGRRSGDFAPPSSDGGWGRSRGPRPPGPEGQVDSQYSAPVFGGGRGR